MSVLGFKVNRSVKYICFLVLLRGALINLLGTVFHWGQMKPTLNFSFSQGGKGKSVRLRLLHSFDGLPWNFVNGLPRMTFTGYV